ncbi:MAG: hypothetical protein JWS10_1737 [Cypionkella sp.]|uniref:hybrid sensor histidine kinase/response regulator n=1 Tax=Cypionkella sp. TaxID=2811411 RepID=UPI002616EE46|nr:response regulator [Cypionkella sp.]MDB5659122.1 hypothetical protein [Cypionkella sp.]
MSIPAFGPQDAQTVTLLGHDLRAALSEVIGGLRLIDPADIPAHPRAQIARARASSEALALLLEQALTLLLGDTSTVPPQHIQTADFLQSITLRWNARTAEHGLSFSLDTEDLPPQIALDPALVERILANLLGNALKYVDSGCIRCTLRATADNQLQIAVQDQGKGFSPATLSRLFTCNNYDAQSDKTGSGLGLYIVWDMVERAGGQITAGNNAAGGAEIIVHLPLPAAAMPQTSPPLLQNLRLLVADDSETGRLLLTNLLTLQGAQITAVADGVQALDQLGRARFDALLIDIEMPQLNGLEVIDRIRKHPGALAQLPILAITAYQMRANKTAILAAGADGLLCKPVLDDKQLAEAVMQVLHRTDKATAAPPQIEPSQFEQLLKMAGPQVANELLHHLHEDLRAAERGLLAASHGPDWPAVRRQSHVMIALAGTAGATALHQLAKVINDLAHQATPDRGTFRTLLPQALEQLDMLIHFVSQQTLTPALLTPALSMPALLTPANLTSPISPPSNARGEETA